MSEHLSAWTSAQFERLGKLSVREQADLAQQAADDFAHRASAGSVGHSRYQNGGYPTGSLIVDELLKDAEPAIAGTQDPAKIRNLLRLDRQLLELFTSRGRNIAAYAEFGLK